MMLHKRAALTESEVQAASQKIMLKIREMDTFKRARTVLFYYPIKNEVDLLPLILECIGDKILCLPRAEDKHGHMTARVVEDISILEEDCHKVLSPPEGANRVAPSEIDFVAVPLAAYDDKINRIGYGGGYYDRYLPMCNNAYKCGVAYSFQRVSDIKHDAHDVKLDAVVTEI